MKKSLLIVSALSLISTSAMASQARLLALGMNETDNEGMYHVSDARNMFLNPAYINVYNDQAIFEWGSAGQIVKAGATDSTASVNNNTASPKAQGGVLKKYGDFVYGLYFGNESNTSSLLRIAGTSAIAALNARAAGATSAVSKTLATSDNQVDIFFGGGSDLKWAVNPVLTFGKDDARKAKDSGISVRGGVIGSGWDAHLNVSLNSKSEATDSVTLPLGSVVAAQTVNQKFKGKLGVQAGGSYILSGNNRVFGYVKHYGWEQTDSYNAYAALDTNTNTNSSGALNGAGGQNGTVKGDFTSIYLGWGSHTDVNTTDKLFYSFAAKKTDINLKFSNKSEVRHIALPLTIGYEAQATEWLVLRGSVVQNIWGQRDNKNIDNYSGATGTRVNRLASNLISKIYGSTGKASLANSTQVNAGATLTFGQIAVDGLISATNGTGAQTKSATDSNAPKVGILSLENLETSVAVTYKF
ncbi:hypothetical protein DOM21_17130 [Bacteriovorax stolpii]|uniref:hypothetical protein n=1 Tax=Bacteriovorax stolpii TaxID=960 RepID=UPI001158B857|nr:hypothetical protein [Bacteriovorax stolpii]QDK43146.1 hypothetical protein DOM21_17130 [Bacteriovorax stolpii]